MLPIAHELTCTVIFSVTRSITMTINELMTVVSEFMSVSDPAAARSHESNGVDHYIYLLSDQTNYVQVQAKHQKFASRYDNETYTRIMEI